MHQVKNYESLVGTLPGFNADLVSEHLKLYEGYVNKYNEICNALETVERKGNYSYAPFSELTRRKSVAWNGAVLHEWYFENLTPNGSAPSEKLLARINEDFGSMEEWRQDFLVCAASTPGWVLLAYNPAEKCLEHYLVFEHQNNVPVGVDILLVLDCWEHAFAKQYGTNKPAYLEAFLGNLHWEEISGRLR